MVIHRTRSAAPRLRAAAKQTVSCRASIDNSRRFEMRWEIGVGDASYIFILFFKVQHS